LFGADDGDVVNKAQAHAKAVHRMDLSREQALEMEMAQPAQAAARAGGRGVN
jgi:hypothetical protein